MRRTSIRTDIPALGILLALATGAVAQEIVEFPLPPTSGNQVRGLALDHSGRLWFTHNTSAFVLHGIIPAGGGLAAINDDGVVTEYPFPCSVAVPFSGLGRPATTSDGNVWVTTSVPLPGQPAVEPCLQGLPGSGASLPSAGVNLITGPDGNLWFTLPFEVPPVIGRSTKNGQLTTFPVPAGTSPTDLAAGPDGNVWFTDYQNAKVGRITASGAVTLFGLSASSGNPSAIAAGPDGNLWFIEANNKIGRMSIDGSVTDFAIPTPSSQPFDIALGGDGAMWFTETIGKIGRITTAGVISEVRVPYANASPALILGKPDGSIWFTDSPGFANGNDRIGRLSPGAGCVADPQTLCLDIGAFSVTASFQRTPEGPSIAANAVALTGNTGYFWFFDPSNVEMTVKVLDGCSVNGHYWVFGGGMTNVGVEWRVTRLQTGDARDYANEFGAAFPPVQDTAAFPCP